MRIVTAYRQNQNLMALKQIAEGLKATLLPEGWFYNGTSFVSMDGVRQQSHPELNTATEAFIRKHNELVRSEVRFGSEFLMTTEEASLDGSTLRNLAVCRTSNSHSRTRSFFRLGKSTCGEVCFVILSA